jgi:hypothetical protein
LSSYVSLAALKEAVGLSGSASDTVDDGVLNSLIIRASGRVDGFLEQNRTGYVGFAASSNSRTAVGSNTRVYDGSGTDTLFIDDFTSVATISVNTTSISSNSWRLWPYNETPKRAVIFETPSPASPSWITTDHWSLGTANVGVTGYAGVDHVPSDVEQTTLSIAITYWHRYQRGEPDPAVTPQGVRGFIESDPEVEGLLWSGLSGWISHGVWGA